MDKSTAPSHWKTVLLDEQGRSIKWLADATDTKVRTVYSYSNGTRPTPSAWLAKASAALGVQVTA